MRKTLLSMSLLALAISGSALAWQPGSDWNGVGNGNPNCNGSGCGGGSGQQETPDNTSKYTFDGYISGHSDKEQGSDVSGGGVSGWTSDGYKGPSAGTFAVSGAVAENGFVASFDVDPGKKSAEVSGLNKDWGYTAGGGYTQSFGNAGSAFDFGAAQHTDSTVDLGYHAWGSGQYSW